MKFIHLSDLHIGKRVNAFPMTEDQRYILDQIIEIIRSEDPEAVLIAGDVYDKPTPPAEAVQLFDDFISELAEMDIEVFIISGNHDSAERLSFGSRIMDKRGIHFAGGYDGGIHMFSLEDEYGKVNFYMLPFLKPVHVRAVIEANDEKGEDIPDIRTYTDAVRYAIDNMHVDEAERNVLIAHQYVTGAARCDSEEVSVGGIDNVDIDVFKPFDYTALGHLHGPQGYGPQRIRYCGSPLKYSFSEAEQPKSVTVVEFGDKKDGVCRVHIKTPGLIPAKDLRVLKGSFYELTDKNYYRDVKADDYFRIILTDEEDIIGALSALRAVYPNIMRLDYDNARTKAAAFMPDVPEADGSTPLEIFSRLYEKQNGSPMSAEQAELVVNLIEKIRSEER
ncbi:MAG: exonuclease SbcCD subunit D [Clostridiales bacterium]|nr:exonuclease SbcCD subunit D [Clostridiales bacterium]